MRGGDYVSDSHKPHHHPCFRYTALGNSIAFGEGASFTVNDTGHHGYGYVYYFRDFLSSIFPCVNLTNLAVPGDTSTNLLQRLQINLFREAVKKADLITISIGANDLLECLAQLPPAIPACLSDAVATFTLNWPLIMEEIRKRILSHAKILVMTVYNPVPANNPIFSLAEPFIRGINQVIKANRFKFDYKVVDVHDDFLGQLTDSKQLKVCSWTHFCATQDPHPTDAGHLEIARLHELAFLRNHQKKLHLEGDDESCYESSRDEGSD